MARGDHIYVERIKGVYTHHGIDCGDGTVIHYTAQHWYGNRSVQRTTLDEFTRGGLCQVKDYRAFFKALSGSGLSYANPIYQFSRLFNRLRGLKLSDLDLSPQAVVDRAESRLGEQAFSIIFHNCEHFATWCKTGIIKSDQVSAIWVLALGPLDFVRYQTNYMLLNVFEPKWLGKGR